MYEGGLEEGDQCVCRAQEKERERDPAAAQAPLSNSVSIRQAAPVLSPLLRQLPAAASSSAQKDAWNSQLIAREVGCCSSTARLKRTLLSIPAHHHSPQPCPPPPAVTPHMLLVNHLFLPKLTFFIIFSSSSSSPPWLLCSFGTFCV